MTKAEAKYIRVEANLVHGFKTMIRMLFCKSRNHYKNQQRGVSFKCS